MPWNDNKGSGGAGGGSGGGGPWGGGGSGGGDKPGGGNGDSPWGKPGGGKSGGPGKQPPERPDLEETLRRMQDRFSRRREGGGNGSGGGARGPGGARGFGTTGLAILVAVGVIGWLFTGIYQVNEQEQAVVTRFGNFERYEGPGFRIRLPNPIERHVIVRVNAPIRTTIAGGTGGNLMLTGDENIVDIDFVITWRIIDPRKYLFNVVDLAPRNPERHELLEQIGESAMREVVGTSAFEPIITGNRTGVETRVRDVMQQTLNGYQAGIQIDQISMSKSSAPEQVVEVQREVSSAEQDKAKKEAEGIAYANKVVPEAKGEAQKMIQEAEGYKLSRVADATGETQRFNLIYEQYRAAPRVTRERMFLETMERVLGRTDNIIVDTKSGTVPILPLDQLRGRQQAPQGQ
jgi:modulator of FtsH protease HflK